MYVKTLNKDSIREKMSGGHLLIPKPCCMKSFRSQEHLQEQTNCAGTITAPPFGLPNSRNIWLLHDHRALTSKNKLHIKRKTDTVPGGKKGHYKCLCVFRCVFVWCGTYGWSCVKVNGRVLEWICMTSLSRLHLPPLTQQTVDTWVYISLCRQWGMNAHTLLN